VVTAWCALTASNRTNGALEVVSGTHLLDQLPHHDTFAPENLLSRGQEIAVDIGDATPTMIELEPGTRTVTLNYQAPMLLRVSYVTSLLLWLIACFLIVRLQRRPSAA
jgi:hypothetical protein